MAKRAPKTGKSEKGRVITRNQGWGGESKEIAPEPAPPEPVVVPEGVEAVKALQELGVLNDAALVAKDKWSDSAARTKDLKARYDEAVELVQARLKKATHPPALPLFDAAEAEADRQKMVGGPVAWGSGVEPVAEPVLAGVGPEAVTEPTEPPQGETSTSEPTLAPDEAGLPF